MKYRGQEQGLLLFSGYIMIGLAINLDRPFFLFSLTGHQGHGLRRWLAEKLHNFSE
jgi:hypothetical protein